MTDYGPTVAFACSPWATIAAAKTWRWSRTSRFSGERMTWVLDAIAALRGYPKAIVLDNGLEMYSLAMLRWAADRGVRLHLIEVREMLAAWRARYNGERPHGSLGWRTPEEFAASFSATSPSKALHISLAA